MAAGAGNGSKLGLLLVLVVVIGAGAGLWVNKDRIFDESVGPDTGGSGEIVVERSTSGASGKADAPAPDEIPVHQSAAAYAAEQKAWLTDNALQEGVKVTESGLQFRILSEGGGSDKPRASDIVQIHYRGRLTDGIEFDSSYNYGEPAEFPLDEVIDGWTEGVQLMSVGDAYELIIPSELGYGSEGSGDEIPGHSVLIFEVELLDIIRP